MNVPRILIVEDDILIGTHIADTLTDNGYAAELVCSLAEAEPACQSGRYDAVILDFRVGADPSLEFARALAAAGTPFLFCTGSIEEEVHEVLRDAVVVTKPFRDDELIAAVAGLLVERNVPA